MNTTTPIYIAGHRDGRARRERSGAPAQDGTPEEVDPDRSPYSNPSVDLQDQGSEAYLKEGGTRSAVSEVRRLKSRALWRHRIPSSEAVDRFRQK